MRTTPTFGLLPLLVVLSVVSTLPACDDGVGPSTPDGPSDGRFEVVGTGFGPVLNNSGEVAFNRRSADGVVRPMLYGNGEVTALPLAGDSGSVVDINDRGDVLGYDLRAVVWKADGTTAVIDDGTTEEGAVEVVVGDLNGTGVVVGGIRPAGETDYTPVRWLPGAPPEILPLPNLPPPALIAINDRGDVVAADVLLRVDGSTAMARWGGTTPRIFEISDDRSILAAWPEDRWVAEGPGSLGLFTPGVSDDFVYGAITVIGADHGSVNAAGDFTYTQWGPHEGFRHHYQRRREQPAEDGGIYDFISLNTLGAFAFQDPEHLRVVGLNEHGVVAVTGFGSPVTEPKIALFHHPALER